MNLSVPPGNICDDVRIQRVVLTQNSYKLYFQIMFWVRDVDGTKSAEGLTADRLSGLQMESL